MPTLVVGMSKNAGKTLHAHGKRGHGTRFKVFPQQKLIPKQVSLLLTLCLAFLATTMVVAVGASSSPAEAQEVKNAATPAAVTGPRDLLARCGVDDSHFAKLIDGRPIDDNETETLMLILFRVRDFPLTEVERWAHPTPNLVQLAEDPQASRGEFFRLSGRVTRVDAIKPAAEMAARFELDQYYRCQLVLDANDQPAVIYTRKVPRAWQSGGDVNQRAVALGLFLKLAGQQKDRPTPVFAAPRIAWHPNTLLGDLGMDVGLLDEVENRTAINAADRECFYQMLAAVGRAKPGQLMREAQLRLNGADQQTRRVDSNGNPCFSVVPLFNDAERQRGQLFDFSGTARRVVRITVSDPDIVARFGIDHYYNLFVFTDDSQGNPLVFCVRELPQGMPTGDGERYGEYVRVAGFFLKTWAYRVQRPAETTAADGKSSAHFQLAPLLIGEQPVWYRSEKSAGSAIAGAIAGGLFVLALLGIWLAAWRYGRGDRQFRRRTIAGALTLDTPLAIDQIPSDAGGTPDFRGLEEEVGKDEG